MSVRGVCGSAVVMAALAVTGCKDNTATGPGGGSGAVKLTSRKGGTPVATVGDTTITVEDLEERINAQGPFARPRFQDVARRKEFLDGLIRQELLAQEALRRGYAEDPEVQDALRKVMVQKLTRQEYDTLVKPEDISAAEIKKFYDEHPDEFHKPEMARCAAWVANKGTDPAAAKKRADARLKSLKDALAKKPDPAKPPTDPFRDAVTDAKDGSDDAESKALGGDLRYLSRPEMDDKFGPAVGQACFDLANINDLSGVVEGKNAYFILKNTGRRKALDRSLDQVESQIRNRLFREKRTEAFTAFVEKLKNQTHVSVDEAKLAAMKLANPAPGAPPGLPPNAGAPPPADPGHAHPAEGSPPAP